MGQTRQVTITLSPNAPTSFESSRCTSVPNFTASRLRSLPVMIIGTTSARPGNVTLLPHDIIANITNDEIEHIRVITLEDTTAELVVPTKELFDISPSTLVDWTFEYNIRGLYRWAMYWFWFGVVTVGPTGRLLSYIVFHITRRPQPDTENNATYRFNTKPTWIERCQFWTKRYLTLLPTPGYTPPESTSWYTVPPLLQSLTVAAFVVMNIILCAVNYRAFNGNFYTKSSIQVWRYLADRTGIMAVANLPIIWLFAMRNNFLLWVTGWHFGTFNNFHRWTARVATVQALLHSIGYTVIYLQDYGRAEYESDFRVNWFYCGVIATITMVLGCSIAFTQLRRRFYEIFLYGHIALSIVCLVTLWVHVDYMGSDDNNFIWASAAIWSFDRLLRLGRIAILNFKFWNARATASYSSDADVIRLQVPLSSDLLKPVAGACYYFYVFNGIKFWENHPFTLASFVGTTPPIQQQSTPSPKDVLECKTTELDIAPVSPSISSSQNSSELMPTTPSLLFIIRPQNGFTRSLRNTITRSNEKNAAESTKMRVLVEGPYGSRLPLHLFDHILFVVYGSGITVALSHISMGLTFAKPNTTINIVWAVRQEAFFEDVCRAEFAAITGNDRITIDVYLTGCKVQVNAALNGRVRIHQGRPVVGDLIMDERRDEGRLTAGTSSAIVTCGVFTRMVVDARNSLLKAMAGSGSFTGVEFFKESFAW